MIAEIHGPFVKPQAITPISSEARTAKIEHAKARQRGKEQEMPSGPNDGVNRRYRSGALRWWKRLEEVASGLNGWLG